MRSACDVILAGATGVGLDQVSIKRPLLLVLDVTLVAVSTLCAVLLRDNLVFDVTSIIAVLPHLVFTCLFAIPVLYLTGASEAIWRFSNLNDYLALLFATVVIVTGATAMSFIMTRLEGVARSIPILQGVLILLFLTGARVAMRVRHAGRQKPPRILTTADSGDGAMINTLVVGIGPLTDAYLRSVAAFVDHRIKVVGVLGRSRQQTGRQLLQFRILGVPEELDNVLRSLEVHGVTVDRIVVAAPVGELSDDAQAVLARVARSSTIEFDYLFERLAQPPSTGSQPMAFTSATRSDAQPPSEPLSRNVSAATVRNPSRLGTGDASSSETDGATDGGAPQDGTVRFSIERLDPQRLKRRRYWSVKRFMDVVGALLLLVLLSPLFIVVGVLVALDLGFPVTFWQQRPGLAGRPFRLYKFRTMAAAHDRRGILRSDSERISRLGRFLRKTRLDELPQLISVLQGSMSFIGPRPLLPRDQAPEHAARLLVRPGITGWAQVIGGRTVSAPDKAILDVWYVRNASFRLDIETVIRTVGVLLRGEEYDTERIAQARDDLARDGILIDHRGASQDDQQGLGDPHVTSSPPEPLGRSNDRLPLEDRPGTGDKAARVQSGLTPTALGAARIA